MKTETEVEEIKKVTEDVDMVSDEALKKQASDLGVPFLAEAPIVEKDVADVIPEDVAGKFHMASFEKKGNVVKVALINLQDFEALNVLRFIAQNKNVEFEVYLTSEKILTDILRQNGGGAEGVIAEAVQLLKEGDDEKDVFASDANEESGSENYQSAPVTRLLGVIIRHAIDGKASDIHVEPYDKEYRVRFRVDGILHSSLAVPMEVGRAVVSRIKILSNLKIDEKRKPQDGRFAFVEDRKAIDFRVSTMPVVNGEKVVLRLLDKESKVIDMKEMGIMGAGNEILLRNIMEPFGIILITGPTGSGKSTTLYSCLEILNKEDRNIITLEDPVEYSIEGVNQSQINPEIGYTFASGLRSTLRQDPNVIMVGEIRDGETAELTIHAALTGHLVLSTLHTNSSIGAIPRLVDMGIEPFLLSSSLRVVAAQRLVRRICTKCKEEVPISPKILEYIQQSVGEMNKEELDKYDFDLSQGFHLYQGKGCDACANSGYKGRIAIFEALEVDSEIKDIISEKNGNEAEIKKHAEKSGMVTIKQDGIIKALKGLTTYSEVERVTEGSLTIGGELDDDKG